MVSTQRQTHCCEWLLCAAFPVSSHPDMDTTVGDGNAANLQPSAHGGSTRHWIPCRVGHGKRPFARTFAHAARLAAQSLTTHALVPARTGQHVMPTADGARDCLLFIDAVCATAAAAVTTICEGVSMARDKPVVAASM